MGLAADDSFDPISGYDDLPGEQSSRPVLTVGDLADNSDLSDIGPLEDDDNDVDNEQPRACTARSGDRWLTSRPSVRDEPCKTSADVARERQQSGQSSGLDPTFPSYASTRRGASAMPQWTLSKATSSNASAAASPGSVMRAPSRPKGTGLAVPGALQRRPSNGGSSSAIVSTNSLRSPSSSLIVMDDGSPLPTPVSPPRPQRKVTRSMDKEAAAQPAVVVEINSSPPEEKASKPPPGSSKSKGKNRASRMQSSDDEADRPPPRRKNDSSAVASLKPARNNKPIPSTAKLTARRVPGGSSGGLRDVGNEWDSSRALSKSKRKGDEKILDKALKAAVKGKRAAGKRVKGQGKPSQTASSSSDEETSALSSIESADVEEPKAPRPKPKARTNKMSSPSPAPPQDIDLMAKLLGSSRQRQAQLEEKQRTDDEKERERYAREGPAVLVDGPMAQIRAAGGRGALRALGSSTSFGNAVAGPSSQPRSRAGSNASSTSSLTSLDSLTSDDELTLGAAPSKIKLCPYCSEPLPVRQTKKLKKLFQRLEKKSVPMPTSINPDARSLAISKSSVVCALHRSESVLIPEGVRKGYPLRIDWPRTIERVREHETALLEVVRRKDSVFWEFARERTGEVGKGVSRSARGQFDVFEKCQPGYFGEIGQILFHQTLVAMFARPPAPVLTSAHCEPLTASDFIYWVLIPELAILLIQEDLGVSYREAFEAMKDSREFGLSVFGVEEGEQAGGALMAGWDEHAEEVASGDERGITILRRKLTKSTQHRKSRTSQRAAEGFPPYDPKAFERPGASSSSGPASSQTARAGAPRARSPPLALGSSQLSTSSSRAKRKETDAALEAVPEPVRKKVRP